MRGKLIKFDTNKIKGAPKEFCVVAFEMIIKGKHYGSWVVLDLKGQKVEPDLIPMGKSDWDSLFHIVADQARRTYKVAKEGEQLCVS